MGWAVFSPRLRTEEILHMHPLHPNPEKNHASLGTAAGERFLPSVVSLDSCKGS